MIEQRRDLEFAARTPPCRWRDGGAPKQPKFGWLLIGVVVAGFLLGTPCYAVIVFEKGKSEPIRGYLVSQDAVRLVIKEVMPDGSLRERVLPRSTIEDILRAVSDERLEALRKEEPQGYRDYAEELAAKREDPDARPVALRLYLIAAYLDPEKLGRSCLLGMANLARNSDEERKFRAMAFLLDTDHDRSVLRKPARRGFDLSKMPEEQRSHLDVLLRALREGRFDDAQAIAKQPALEPVLQQIASTLKVEDFADLRRGERTPPALLRRVIVLSLLSAGVSPAGLGEESATASSGGWSVLSDAANTAAVIWPSLETITEFDPTHCSFRDGKWGP